MILSRRAALDGAQLDEIDSRILIQGIEIQAGKDSISTASPGGADGLRVTGEKRDSLDILIRFSINEKSYHPADREEVFEKAMSWAAAGGELTVNYKPGRVIRVIPVQFPGEGDIRNRENQYNITFRAMGIPYWQEETPTQITRQGSSRWNGTITCGGNRETWMEFSFQNTSGNTINAMTISTESSQMTFNGLGLANRETLILDHDDNGKRCLQRIRIRDIAGRYRSAMARREGADELKLEPGQNAVAMRADRAGTLILTAAGRFA